MKIGDKVRVIGGTAGGPDIGTEGIIVIEGVNGPEIHAVRFAGWNEGWPIHFLPDMEEPEDFMVPYDMWGCAETQLELVDDKT